MNGEELAPLPEQLRRDLAGLPDSPGVYLMHSSPSQILYIGKAKNLQRRVRSYFTGKKDLKTEMLRRKVTHLEVLLCGNDYEALILENNLIKRHKPKYNINLKDDKTYPMICISHDEYPRIFKTRNIKRDGSQYFGPYPNGLQLETTLQLIAELFPLRRCTGKLKQREHPCLYYHMQQCLGPCIDAISKEEYRQQVQRAKHLLQGSNKVLQQELEREMRHASEQLRFEEAARLRNQIRSLRDLQQEQSMELQERAEVGRDYLAILQQGDRYFFTVLLLRQGKILGQHCFSSRYLPNHQEGAQEVQGNKSILSAALVEFLCLYYLESKHDPPAELYLPDLDLEWSELELFLQLLQAQCGKSLLLCPFSRERKAANNRLLLLRARENVIRQQQLWLRYQGCGLMLEELQKALDLESLPEHIEGFDISHMDGNAAVASLIVFRSGKPAKEEYRSFNLRSTEGRIDDFSSMQEAVSRRYTRLLNEGLPLPDLIMVDGGQGQVNAAAHVLRGLDVSIPLVGLAKREEILFFPHLPPSPAEKNPPHVSYSRQRPPLDLPPGHPGLKLLQHVRDETHRWAHGKNRKRYEKRMFMGLLENVPGVGQKRSNALLQYYGSLEAMTAANTRELAQVGRMSQEVAETLAEYLVRRN